MPVFLIIIVIGALLSIQVYIKRGIQGRLRSAADDIGDQYAVGNTNRRVARRHHSNVHETFKLGVQNSALQAEEMRETIIRQNVLNADQAYWGN